MSLPGLILIAFFTSIQAVTTPIQNIECENVKAEIKITPGRAGNTVKINPSGGSKPYRIVLFETSGRLISEDFKRQTFEGVASGTYTCVIIDGQNCRKSIDFNVP